jgi:hypothetical protein
MLRARPERPTVFRQWRFIEVFLFPRGEIRRHRSIARLRSSEAPRTSIRSVTVPQNVERMAVERRTAHSVPLHPSESLLERLKR